MSEFSQLLSSYIQKKSIKVYAMAQYCDLDRSTMYKIIRGKRTPTSLSIVQKIADFIHLAPGEQLELEEAYTAAIVGYDNYYRRKDMMKFLSEFSTAVSPLPPVFMNALPQSYEEDIVPLHNKMEVNQALFNLTTAESQKSNGHLHLLMQPDFSFLTELMISIAHKNEHLSIDHIICFNNTDQVTPSRQNYNLRCLQNILPLYTCSCNYQPYYYYDNILSHLDTFRLFPYMMLTEDYALMISDSLQKGIIYHQKSVISLLQEMFSDCLASARPLLTKLVDVFDQLLHIQEFSLNQSITPEYLFQMTPCFTPFITREILEKHVCNIPGREVLIQSFQNYCASLSEKCLKCRPVAIFSEAGVQRFLETGRIDEYPSDVYMPFSLPDRIFLIQKLMLGTHFQLRMLKQQIGNIENGLNLYISPDFGNLIFSSPASGRFVYLDMKEAGLLCAFRDFLETLDAEMFYTEEEMQQRIHTIIMRLQ